MANSRYPQVRAVGLRLRRYEPSLCRRDGTDYPGGTIIRALRPDYKKKFPKIVEYADNTRGWSVFGKDRPSINSMVVECVRRSAAQQIMNDVADEDNKGLFMLVIPPLPSSNSTVVKRYAIRFFAADFDPVTVRRSPAQLFRATISDIEIIGRRNR